ncbi:MAG: hypothetical protein STSR0008_15690 [Ignavibacterium sp.]
MNISENDNTLDLDLALKVIDYFRLDKTKVQKIIAEVKEKIRNWKNVAAKYDISKEEQNLMANAFKV